MESFSVPIDAGIDQEDKLKYYEISLPFLVLLPLFLWFGRYVVILKHTAQFLRLIKPSTFVDAEFNIVRGVDEGLGEYWSLISGNDRKRWFAKEVHLRHWFGVKILDDDQLEKLRTSKKGKKTFASIYNYDPLSDYRFCDSLHYQKMEQRVENKSSDFIAQVLYLGEDRIQGAYGHC